MNEIEIFNKKNDVLYLILKFVLSYVFFAIIYVYYSIKKYKIFDITRYEYILDIINDSLLDINNVRTQNMIIPIINLENINDNN